MSTNQHTPRVVKNGFECAAPGCIERMHIGENAMVRAREHNQEDPAAAYASLWRRHSRQFEGDGAPDITVEWELVASCSACPDGGEMETADDGDVACSKCHTYWNERGEGGTIDEDELETLRDKDHAAALAHAEWLIAGRDLKGGIRMRGGRGSLVADADNTRANVEEWLARSQPGHYQDMYQSALDLLDREAAAGAHSPDPVSIANQPPYQRLPAEPLVSDPRDTEHVPCNCVPNLGPPHCHLCESLGGQETEWPCGMATP